jgi:hypothetical protein
MSRPADSPADGEREPTSVPEAEGLAARTEEQELAAGRTAATPFLALGGVGLLIAIAVVVVMALVVLAIYLA